MNFFDSGEIKKAGKEFRAAIKINEKSALAHYFLGLTLADSGDFEDAKKELSRAIELKPEWVRAKLFLAVLAIISSDLDTAEKYLKQILEKYPDNNDALILLGMTYAFNFKMEASIDSFEKARVKNKNNLMLNKQLGLAYLLIGRAEEAIKIFEETKKYYPEAYALNRLLGSSYTFNGDFLGAEKAYTLPDWKLYPRCLLELGDLYMVTGQFAKAMDSYKKSLEYFPKTAGVYENIANAALQNKDVDTAILQYEKIKEISPGFAGWAYGLGVCYSLKGDREKSVAFFKKALEIDPGNEQAKKMLIQLGEKIPQ